MNRRLPRFENRMTPLQTALGWIWFPVHVLLLPLLLNVYAAAVAPRVSVLAMNLAYVGAGLVFVLVVMFSFLRRSFDPLADRPGFCFRTILLGLAADFVLSIAVGAVFSALSPAEENPNNAFILELAGEDFGPVAAMTVFLAPIVEEMLFRGVVFGSIAPRSRFLAYAVSAALFSLDHVWQYAAARGDLAELAYAVQYVPVSLVLAWCYDRTGSIWTPIFFHMGFNAMSFVALG